MKTEDLKQKPFESSLNVVMGRFGRIPYQQFQQELDDWFYTRLSERLIDQKQLPVDLTYLSHLVSAIYHHAELFHLLTDHCISYEQVDK